jgi:hypothetical protein
MVICISPRVGVNASEKCICCDKLRIFEPSSHAEKQSTARTSYMLIGSGNPGAIGGPGSPHPVRIEPQGEPCPVQSGQSDARGSGFRHDHINRHGAIAQNASQELLRLGERAFDNSADCRNWGPPISV